MDAIARAPKINPKSIVFNEVLKELNNNQISISEDNKNKLKRIFLDRFFNHQVLFHHLNLYHHQLNWSHHPVLK